MFVLSPSVLPSNGFQGFPTVPNGSQRLRAAGSAPRCCSAACGGFLTQFRGHFQSPNYPDHYDDSAICRWYIFAPKEFAILIEKHSIDIEDDASRVDCPYDYLRVGNHA